MRRAANGGRMGSFRRERRPEQAPGITVGPAVVRALDALRIGRFLDEQSAPMSTQVGQGREVSRLAVQVHGGLVADLDRKLVPGRGQGVFAGDEDPVPVPGPVPG